MEETICIDCETKVNDPVRPQYRIKGNGKLIRPKARCASCRAKYEAIRVGTGPDKGLVLVENGGDE